MYPGYKPQDALNEYAITFFALLNEGYRQRYENYQMLATIQHVKDPAGFIKQLKWLATDHNDILKPTGEGTTDPAELKRLLGG